MKLPLYQVVAFAARAFEGNPAAVCPLPHWLPDAVLQAIAEENNLSETAFFVAADDGYHLRWFTPVAEVDLCGHATLAAAHVLFQHLGSPQGTLRFQTRSGLLTVQREGSQLIMDFPAQPPVPCATSQALSDGLGRQPAHCQLAPYWSERLGKTRLNARQVSRRGGDVVCEIRGDRVRLAGTAVTYLHGEIDIG